MEDIYKYGVPEQKKFPMPDADHVRSAIRFFNYVDPRYEKELASAILRRMKEYGLSFDDFTVGEENRFSKYVPKTVLQHHGIKGQRWGVRRFQNEDGTRTDAGKKRYSSDNAKAKKADREIAKIKSNTSKELDSIYETKRKELDSLYEKAMKEDPDLDYEKSAWKKINSIEADLGIKGRNVLEKSDSEIERIARDYADNYFSKHESLSVNDLSKKFINSGSEVVAVLLDRYSFEQVDNDYIFKKK